MLGLSVAVPGGVPRVCWSAAGSCLVGSGAPASLGQRVFVQISALFMLVCAVWAGRIEHVREWVVLRGDGDVFDDLAENHRLKVACGVREWELVARACEEWRVDDRGAGEAAERLVRGGHDGTALVGEFLALELAGLLGISPTAAALRVRDTLDLRDRHPELWGLVVTGRVPGWRALKVVTRCVQAGLSGEAARWVDHQLGGALQGLPWVRWCGRWRV